MDAVGTTYFMGGVQGAPVMGTPLLSRFFRETPREAMAMSRLVKLNGSMTGKEAVVVGAGSSGRAAVRLLAFLGARVRMLERDASRLDGSFVSLARELGVEIVSGDHEAAQFRNADLVILSPGIPAARIQPLLPEGRSVELMAELELASRCVTEPILAVTGTNGKTTTVNLCAAMLQASGRKVFLGGNIGTPLSEYVLSTDKADVLVLEVSSFQLQTCSTFKPWAAVLINFSPNHLDWHADMEEYLTAKLNLFANQDEDDLAVFPSSLRQLVEERRPTRARIVYFGPERRFLCPGLPGEHNLANMEAAYQACRHFGVTESEAQRALGGMKGLPHRIERVGEVRGVLFVNDSKATTVDSLEAALKSFDRPIRLLAGGVFKGGDLKILLPAAPGAGARRGVVRRLAGNFRRGMAGWPASVLGADPGPGHAAAVGRCGAGRRDPAVPGHGQF